MEESGSAKCVKLLLVIYSDGLAEGHGVALHSPDVTVSDLILGVDRERQSFDCRKEDTIQLLVLFPLRFDSLC